MATNTTAIETARAKFWDDVLLEKIKEKTWEWVEYNTMKQYLTTWTFPTKDEIVAKKSVSQELSDRLSKKEWTTIWYAQPFDEERANKSEKENIVEVKPSWWDVPPIIEKAREQSVDTTNIEKKDTIEKKDKINKSVYTWPSIVDYLNSTGQDSSQDAREKLAKKLWIENYKRFDNADQNTQMLNILRGRDTKNEERDFLENKKIDKWWEIKIPWVNVDEEWKSFDKNEINFDTSNLLELYWDDLSDIDKKKVGFSEQIKNKEIADNFTNYNKLVSVQNTNNELILKLYWIDAEWNIDETNKNWFAYKYQKLQKDYEDTQRENLKWFESNRLSQVSWQIRNALLSRGVDVSKIPQEQLVALSWAIWQSAFTDIYNAKTKVEDAILSNTKDIMLQLNSLREKWLLSKTDLDLNLETLRQQYEKNITIINKDFANLVFWIWDAAVTKAENDKKEVLNAVTSLWTSLWLSWTAIWVLEKYITSATSSVNAYEIMIKALNDENSELYKAVANAEEAASLALQFEQNIELAKLNASTTSEVKLDTAEEQLITDLWLVWKVTNAWFKENYTKLLQEVKRSVWANQPYTVEWTDVTISPEELSLALDRNIWTISWWLIKE